MCDYVHVMNFRIIIIIIIIIIIVLGRESCENTDIISIRTEMTEKNSFYIYGKAKIWTRAANGDAIHILCKLGLRLGLRLWLWLSVEITWPSVSLTLVAVKLTFAYK